MITIGIDPILFSIGHFHLRWYGLIVLTAISVGVWVTAREAVRKGFKKEDIYDAALWVLLGGMIGARLFHVIDHWPDEYAANPIRALFLWEGGLAIWGALVGGLISVSILSRLRGWKLPKLLDAAAPGLALAQAIGRKIRGLAKRSCFTPCNVLCSGSPLCTSSSLNWKMIGSPKRPRGNLLICLRYC